MVEDGHEADDDHAELIADQIGERAGLRRHAAMARECAVKAIAHNMTKQEEERHQGISHKIEDHAGEKRDPYVRDRVRNQSHSLESSEQESEKPGTFFPQPKLNDPIFAKIMEEFGRRPVINAFGFIFRRVVHPVFLAE